MASLVLSVAGSAAGSAVFGPAGAIAGRMAGALAGALIDQALFATHRERAVEGPRLANVDVMASTEGAPIPRLYGRARLSGQVIWATRLEEVVSTASETTTNGGGKSTGGSSTTTTTTTYSYFGNVAVGLCEGPISGVLRIWADGKPLDLSGVNVRIYSGDATQTADPLIVAKEGVAPAYRGLAYAVFDRLPLADFGNRIPQLSFEVVRAIGLLEQMTRAITLIPGATEFGYEPSETVQVMGPGQYAPENRHVSHAGSDIAAALDELQCLAPNLERVAVVVTWFGTDLRAGHCRVLPGIDSREKTTAAAIWSVAGVSDRSSAYLVSRHVGRAAYGGTPSDESVRNLIADLKARGLKVTLYPFVMMDIPAGNTLPDPWTGAASQPPYPWRGRITAADGPVMAAAQVNAFFTGGDDGWNYANMVLHYAALAASAGGVDAFLIGSELRSLTRVRAAPGVYPAVTALVALAGQVKAIVGAGTAVTYGADWTEYGAHVVDPAASEVRFPLDALWASPAIDCIGIDYYAPLADWRDDGGQLDLALTDNPYSVEYLAGNLRRGEGYDWYYADSAARIAQARTPITDGLGKPWIYRQKDLWSFWQQPHYERVGGVELPAPTAWVPQSKPIWLTEIGCPAVDKGANQPSVFPDPKSSESHVPYFSSGARDDLIQRRMLEAILSAFDPAFGDAALNPVSPLYGGRMITPETIHLWSWDARPYPVFPAAADVWGDAPNWETGHWLTGRFGSAPLDRLVSTILADSGIDDVDTRDLGEGPDGYVVDRPMAPRAMLDPLALTYCFYAIEQDGHLRFRQRGGATVAELDEDDLVLPDEGPPARLTRVQESDLPREVAIGYTDAGTDYQRAAAMSRRLVGGSQRTARADLAIVAGARQAERRAEIWLQDLWAGRERASVMLPPSRLALMPGDVVGLHVNGRRRLIEVQEISDRESREVRGRSVNPDVFNLALAPAAQRPPAVPPAVGPAHALVLDLPALPAEGVPVLARLAVFAQPWPGPMAVWQSTGGAGYSRLGTALAPAIIGETRDDLPGADAARWQRHGIRVTLYGGALASASDSAVLAGANAAAIRHADGAWEVIQFANAELVGPHTYILSRLLRGQAGSERAIAPLLAAGAPFVMLDRSLVPLAVSTDALERTMQLRVVAAGRDHADPSAVALTATPHATALKPLTPVQVKARRGSGGVTIGWTRRTRLDGDSWEGEVPLGEATERYAIDIMAGGMVLRTLNTTVPSALYAAADEIADFGAPQDTLYIRVVQLSATAGRGFAGAAVLSV